MKVNRERKPLFDWIFDIVLFSFIAGSIYLFLPSVFQTVLNGWWQFYQTTRQYFQTVPSFLFIGVFAFSQLLVFAGAIYLYRPAASATAFRETTLRLLKQIGNWVLPPYSKYVLNKNKYATITNQNGLLIICRQLLVTIIVTLLFSGFYFLLRHSISNDQRFFEAQLRLSHLYLAVLFVQLVLFAIAYRKELIPFFKTWFSEPGSAYNLAIFRIVCGFQLFVFYTDNLTTNSYWASLPANMRVSLPYMSWLIQNIPITPNLYHVVCLLGIFCAVCICTGLFTRAALIANIPLGIYIMGVPFFFGTLFHRQIWVWFPAILAFSSCSDVLSLDVLIKNLRGKTPTIALHPKYRIPFSFIWLHFGIIYFFSGIGKLAHGGFAWALGPSMINQVQLEWAQWYGKTPPLRVDHYPTLLHIAGVAVILFELYYPFLIFTSLGRLIAFFGGLSMHNALQYVIYIGFKDLQLSYVSFINWQWFIDRYKKLLLKIQPSEIPSFNFSSLFNLSVYRAVFITGTLLYIINFGFGLFNINSWPFSAYPTYSAIVPSTRHYVHFEAFDKAGQRMVVYNIGQAAHFQMESFTPIEDEVQNRIIKRDTAGMKESVRKLWDIWLSNVPKLKEADSVAVYMRESPIVPEKLDSVVSEKYLMSMKF